MLPAAVYLAQERAKSPVLIVDLDLRVRERGAGGPLALDKFKRWAYSFPGQRDSNLECQE